MQAFKTWALDYAHNVGPKKGSQALINTHKYTSKGQADMTQAWNIHKSDGISNNNTGGAIKSCSFMSYNKVDMWTKFVKLACVVFKKKFHIHFFFKSGGF